LKDASRLSQEVDMSTVAPVPSTTPEQAEAFVGRLFEGALGTVDLLTLYIGDRLGLYGALNDGGPATPSELASRCSINERYAREWLEQQAVGGTLTVDDASASEDARRYALPEGHALALTDPESAFSMAPLARAFVGCAMALPKILDAFRTGGGVPWSDFGTDGIEAQGDFNRPWLLSSFGTEYLPLIPDVHERLQADPPAHVADFACGVGWASIAIADAYPKTVVHGFDLDESSIALASKNASERGLSDRVTFEVQDIAGSSLEGGYDLVVVIEAIHDLSRPVEALRSIHDVLAPGGCAIVADEKTGDVFAAPGDDLERLFYGFSVLCCLPAGMSEQPSAGTGTVMRADTMRSYATEAGFSQVEVLDIPHDLLRFYRLIP
jgi:2-polyprenyl-3-methyl-5-hydroxy-6-metoxy-1,4-benzoquinol methylase